MQQVVSSISEWLLPAWLLVSILVVAIAALAKARKHPGEALTSDPGAALQGIREAAYR